MAFLPLAGGGAAVPVIIDRDLAQSDVAFRQEESLFRATWPASGDDRAVLEINLDAGRPLIRMLGWLGADGSTRPLAKNVDPLVVLTVGQRDPVKARRGMVFFDNPRERPYRVVKAQLNKTQIRAVREGGRARIVVEELQAGSFRGQIEFTVFPHSPLVKVEAVMRTDEPFQAFLYDAGLVGESPGWEAMVWLDPHGHARRARASADLLARPLSVRYRAIAAESAQGSLVVFPSPHQYFYPLDFADNFGFVWVGQGWGGGETPFGLGVRQPPDGDQRWVPWMDAPPGTWQRMGLFYMLSSGRGRVALEEAARYTHGDRFRPLPGHKTFTSHYHVEHTVDFLNRQKAQGTAGVPRDLAAPGFVTKFKETGLDVVHLAEFHFGWTPGQKTDERLAMLKAMHEECRRLSDDEILILPGEEPNVHLGGHWISFFPHPVYWVLNRGEEEPFQETRPGYGTVYHVGSPEDVLALMERENGLMWTAHPRIKSSLAFPDGYRDTPFFRSDRFLGAAWKAMPADMSRPRLGWRVLDLLDDMNNWGARKHVLGEVDVFRVEPDYELYAHMNVNYLRLETVPKFDDGWPSLLQALRDGKFFVTTGEILIPEFKVDGRESGELLRRNSSGAFMIRAELDWTFPLAFAEIVSGDGHEVYRETIALSDSGSFGRQAWQWPVNLQGRRWVRLEVWDIAANGAFTPPVWIEAE